MKTNFRRSDALNAIFPRCRLIGRDGFTVNQALTIRRGDLQAGDVPNITIDLISDRLPQPRLKPINGVVWVPAFTDLKLHDITSGPGDPNREPLDQNQPPGSPAFFSGNAEFLTRKLWGIANQHSFGHHGQYTTMKEAVLAHGGEGQSSRKAYQSLNAFEQDCVIEFLKSLQILPPNRRQLMVTAGGEN